MSDKANEGQTLLAIGILLLMLMGLWYLLREDITWLVAQTRLAYLWIFHLFTDHFENIRQWLLHASPDKRVPANLRLSWDNVLIVSGIIGDYMRWPVSIYFLCCMYWAFNTTPRRKFKTAFNLDSLLEVQSRVWPVIKPIVNFNPSSLSARIPGTDLPEKLPLFAESLSPDEWLAYNRIPMRNNNPDEEAMRQAFARQLGPKWDGMKGLRPHHRALLAGFILKGSQKRKESDDLLGAISACWTAERGLQLTADVSKRINAVLNDKKMMAPALEAANAFAYRTTALLGVLRWAREQGGVLAPAQFLWLRGVDRPLWYPLNNLGRRSFHAEAAGAMAHFMAEQAAKRPLPMPRVDNAIPAIVNYVKENVTRLPGLVPDNAKLKMV